MMMNSEKMIKKKPPKDSLTLLPCFYFVELPIVASSMVSLYFLELTDVVQPALVGFRCHDRELSMPYVDSGDELIPMLMLLSLAFAGPAASIMLVEGMIYCLQSRLRLRRPEGSINAGGCNFNSFLRRTVRFVGVHVFGLCATALLTDIIQLSTGYHAPFFLTVCKPNYTLAGCDRNSYITRDVCSGTDQHAIMAARKTFPSSMQLCLRAAVYVSMYFNATISDSTKLLKPVLVFAFAIAAALTGLTQITQHRSHPSDVYVGFMIGAFIAAYLACHAVANFKSSDDIIPAPPPPPPKEDPLRALTERGHESVYNKGPASASESNDEITATPVPRVGMDTSLQGSPGESLKRASVDVELLAPRSPMGKETMLTFSNTLQRSSMNVDGFLEEVGPMQPMQQVQQVQPVQPVQPVQRRLKAVQGPVDPMRSQQLVSEWKQKSMEMRGVRDEVERENSEDGGSEVGSSVGTDDSTTPVFPVHSVRVPSSRNNPTPPPVGVKAVATPRPPQIQEAAAPQVSPKSALTRAKWLSIREKTSGGEASNRTNQPRLMQVIAMSKQQGLLPSSSTSSGEKSSETTSTSSSSNANESPHYREHKENPGIVTVDAHAPHHPVVQAPSPLQAPPLAGNGNPWEWGARPSDPRDSYDLNSLTRGDSSAHGSSFRPHRSASPGADPQREIAVEAQRREMAMRRKTALVLLDREIRNQTEQENYYKSLQGRRFKE
ncbi:Phospholipid phosphatase-related protein type 3 [Dissostichus eleginoides]|uniref:Phospholipid phosphatase-related protein type 3 n=1 Tax=Dissostichus eleginoides TaxID=100907 RepID=A0AAD9CA40_DISEL|nr:Phospholipid phosphatase-related protein type 3 [Dissostichus eleginoides]